jgi:hypothetical protein
MGWADCGTDRNGRPIGYAFEATCDEEGCEEEIDRGLGHACGGMHGEDEYSCERYFCGKHLVGGPYPEDYGITNWPHPRGPLCRSCADALERELKREAEVG